MKKDNNIPDHIMDEDVKGGIIESLKAQGKMVFTQPKQIKWVETFGVITGEKISGMIGECEQFAIYEKDNGKFDLVVRIESYPEKGRIPFNTLRSAKMHAKKVLVEHIEYLTKQLKSLQNTM